MNSDPNLPILLMNLHKNVSEKFLDHCGRKT